MLLILRPLFAVHNVLQHWSQFVSDLSALSPAPPSRRKIVKNTSWGLAWPARHPVTPKTGSDDPLAPRPAHRPTLLQYCPHSIEFFGPKRTPPLALVALFRPETIGPGSMSHTCKRYSTGALSSVQISAFYAVSWCVSGSQKMLNI